MPQSPQSLAKIESAIRHCRRCERYATRKLAVPGAGPAAARIFFLGEAPGRTEDLTGRPFAGRAGAYLDRMLAAHGFDRDAIYITSILKCFHPGPPRKHQIEACRPWTEAQLAAIRPAQVFVMGRTAENGWLRWRMETAAGQPPQAAVVVTSHPAAAMRFPDQHRRFVRGLRRLARLL